MTPTITQADRYAALRLPTLEELRLMLAAIPAPDATKDAEVAALKIELANAEYYASFCSERWAEEIDANDTLRAQLAAHRKIADALANSVTHDSMCNDFGPMPMGCSCSHEEALAAYRAATKGRMTMVETTQADRYAADQIGLSVNDIPDNVLLGRAMRDFCRIKRGDGGIYRWAAVMDRFGLGSTYAQQLCRRFGMDPDEKVRKP